jgi:hypothetical protein
MSDAPAPKKHRLLGGRILTVISSLFLLMDAMMKLVKPQPVLDTNVQLGIPLGSITEIGAILLAITILYMLPRTAVLGAVLITGYLGGAVAIHLRAGSPPFEQVFPVLIGAMAWGGIYLRDPRLASLLPAREDV